MLHGGEELLNGGNRGIYLFGFCCDLFGRFFFGKVLLVLLKLTSFSPSTCVKGVTESCGMGVMDCIRDS